MGENMVQGAPDLVRRHSRWIGLATLVASFCLAWVGSYAIAAAFANFAEPGANRPILLGVRMSGIIAVGLGIVAAIVLQRHAKYQRYSAEVIEELRQCVFPDREETKSDSVVVIIFSVVIGGILWVFDYASSALSTFLYDLL